MYLIENGKCVQSFREGLFGQVDIVKPNDNNIKPNDDNKESTNDDTNNLQIINLSEKKTSWTITFTSQ